MLCPRDMTPCPDDICHGSGCVWLGGEPMIAICQICHKPIVHDVIGAGVCSCESDEDEDYDEWT